MIDWTSWMDYGFMKMALAAILIITPLFGLMGTMIVNKKMAYFSDALGHSALTGIAVGVVCGIPDTNISMVIFAVVFALLLNKIGHLEYEEYVLAFAEHNYAYYFYRYDFVLDHLF